MLEIKNLYVSIKEEKGEKEIIKGFNLKLEKGKVHALMGPNGSGKSTLSQVIMGNPKYIVTKGDILFNKKSILDLKPNERAKLGIFLSFQHPLEVEGVTLTNFLKTALSELKNEKVYSMDIKPSLVENAKLLKIDELLISRYLNEGFSGGEKKKFEILQMLMLNPKLIILDEVDSGLDIDSLKAVADAINHEKNKHEEKTILIITHYKRILNYIKPDKVHIMSQGKMIKEGDSSLVDKLEEKGYEKITEDKK